MRVFIRSTRRSASLNPLWLTGEQRRQVGYDAQVLTTDKAWRDLDIRLTVEVIR